VADRHVTITKVGHHGQAVISYPGELVYADEVHLVARCRWTETTTLDLGPFALQPGDIFIEHYYLDRWFNIFAIYNRLGRLKGWYCNITRPIELVDGEIRWHDLALDLLVLPDGEQVLLDEADFAQLELSDRIRSQAREELALLQRWAVEAADPFGMLA
jgi:protein associated with RNAse G/E